MSKIGYMRVSTADQNLDLQKDALQKAGCERIFADKASGVKERPELKRAFNYLRKGDTLIVWRLDRLGRSLRDLIDLMSKLDKKGVDFQTLQEGIHSGNSAGRLVFNVFGALAEFERNLIKERVNAGLKAAKARGRNGGRPKKLNEEQVKELNSMYGNRHLSIKQISKVLGVSIPTIYNYLTKTNALFMAKKEVRKPKRKDL